MSQTNIDPYTHCPVYETRRFLLRLIEETDTVDLLNCYGDPLAAPIFNSDNCTSDFVYHTREEMAEAMRFWIDSYKWRYFVRFTIVDKSTQKAIGTIEFFNRGESEGYGKVGVLRLDLASAYERADAIAEILVVVNQRFPALFGVDCILTKAIPAAEERIRALESAGYRALTPKTIVPYDDYYLLPMN